MQHDKQSPPSEHVRDVLCRQIAAGRDMPTAAAIAGVEMGTLYAWLARGEREFGGPFRDFVDAVKKAEFAAEYRGTG